MVPGVSLLLVGLDVLHEMEDIERLSRQQRREEIRDRQREAEREAVGRIDDHTRRIPPTSVADTGPMLTTREPGISGWADKANSPSTIRDRLSATAFEECRKIADYR
jgi:hypothetical protein